MYDHLMVPLCETYRIRCVGIDRRGFGKSDWSGPGRSPKACITYETFADDMIQIVAHLEVEEFVFVAASMGCGETVLAWQRSDFVRQHCKVSGQLFCRALLSVAVCYETSLLMTTFPPGFHLDRARPSVPATDSRESRSALP